MTPATPFSVAPLQPWQPSRSDLLARAGQLGPRASMPSLVLGADPVLGLKRGADVAARRARFTRIVKAAVAGCAALCLVALVIELASGTATASDAPSKTRSSLTRDVNTRGDAVRTKATRGVAPGILRGRTKRYGRR